MDIRKALLQEHSKQQTLKIVRYIGADPERFKTLMDLFLGPEYRVTQRGAWALSYVIEKHPSLIGPYLAQTIDLLSVDSLPDAVARNTLRLLQHIAVPEDLQGKLMDACFRFIASPETATAIKAFSLTVLHTLSREHPDILPELELIIRDRWAYETAAFRSRGRKILKGSALP